MLYKPSFCCNCGEKIDRKEWSLFSSRRFCPLCETEHKGQDYFVRGLVVAGVVSGLFGVSAWMRPSPKPAEPLVPAKADVSRRIATGPAPSAEAVRAPATLPSPTPPVATENRPTQDVLVPSKPAATETVYYCQAITRKGTRCTRRVKSPGYCWQHAGSRAASGPVDQR
jgi:hypothetical protein